MIDLSELFEKQAGLDAEIAKNHNVTYESTLVRRTIALLVELGEFANSMRTFKFWSLKPGESKERVLDEYADAMHFFLSLGLAIKNKETKFEIEDSNLDVNELLLKTYQLVCDFSKTLSINDYQVAFKSFLSMSKKIPATEQEIIDAYLIKLDVNYKRQENKY